MKLHILKVEQSHLDMFVSTAECPSPHETPQTGIVVLSCCRALEAEPLKDKQTPQDAIAKLHLLVCL